MEQLWQHFAEDIARRILAWLEAHASVPSPAPALLNVDEAAAYLGRSVPSMRHLIHDREVPVVRVGNRVQLHRADLDAWIAKNKY